MKNGEDGRGCCCKGSSVGSRICVTEQDSKYLNDLKDLEY